MSVVAASPKRSGFDVTRWIEHVNEPKKLILVWQAPDEKKFRTRLPVGEISREGPDYVLRYYQATPEVLKAQELSYQGYPAFTIRQPVHSKDVLDAFMRRLPPRSRTDFGEYLRGLRIKPGTQISDFALLGYSEAKLPGDGFSLVDTLADARPPAEFLLDIAGYRYHPPHPTSEALGKQVELVPEPTNDHDPNAIQILLEGRRIGYINRIQAPSIHRWLSEAEVEASIEKLNGRSDWPRAFIFLKVR